jgi:hypothetical protein
MPARAPLLLIIIIPMIVLLIAAEPASAATPIPIPTEAPAPTPTPDPGDDPPPGVVQQVIHQLLFPAETIGQALANVFNQAAASEAESLSAQTAAWGEAIGEVVQAPSAGWFNDQARASLPTAAALAPALFLLRLAIYHWRRLMGEADSALGAFGDWLSAGMLAVASGPFLDLATRLGWWMTGAALGETADLAREFVSAMTLPGAVLAGLEAVSLFSGIIAVGLGLAGLLAVAGFLFAFAAANAALFVLAVVAPPVAVVSVIPQMRWLRGLWLKAVGLLALLPVVAGAIFKAGLLAAVPFSGGGLLSAVIRLLWLLGAVGALLSLAGILGKITLGTGVGAAVRLAQGVAGVVSLAALAASGAGVAAALGAGAGSAGALANPGGGSPPMTGTGAGTSDAGNPRPGEALPGGGYRAALSHLGQAEVHTRQAGFFGALGLRAPARYAGQLAQREGLAARQAELAERMARLAGSPGGPDDQLGLSPGLYREVLVGFGGPGQDLARGFRALGGLAGDAVPPLPVLAARYPREAGALVRAYLDDPQGVASAEDPLLAAARQAGARGILRDVYGERGVPRTGGQGGRA